METNVNQRLNDIVNYLIFSKVALDKTDLSKKLGYNASSFSQIINERVPLTDRFINRLMEFAPNIDKNWLLTGEGTMLKVPAATMTPIGEQWVEADFSQEPSMKMQKREDGTVVIYHTPEQRSRATAYARQLQRKGVGVILDSSAPAGVTGTLPKAQPSATPTEAMRDGVNVITDAESVDLSVLPVEVVEEIKAEVAEEIKREESIIIVSPEVANTPGTNIKKYIKDKGDELERMYLGDLLPDGVNIAERVRKTSMLPSFQPGDWIFVKFINKDNITDGETYYFDFNTRPTMIRKVKLEGDDLRLIAKNHQFGDIIIKRDEINNIGDIVGMFRGYFGDQYDDIEALRRKKDAQTDELIKCNGDLIKQNGDALKIVDRLVAVIEKKQ